DPHLVADLATQQPVNRQPGGFASQVPQRHLDRADRTAPWLERAALTDVQHDALDLGRIGTQDVGLVHQHVGFEVWLVRLHGRVAAESLIGDDPYDGVVADDGALEIGNLHQSSLDLITTSGRWPKSGSSRIPRPE